MDFYTPLSLIPAPNAKRIALRISPPAERALRQGHPWVFDQAITEQSHAGAPGDLAVIFDDKRRFLAVGLYDPISPIRVRILQSRQPATINADWFKSRLLAALRLRLPLIEQPAERATTGYRLVHGENDGLPGLVIDRYAETLVLKLYTPAWIPHLKELCSALEQASPAEGLILRLSRSMLKQDELLFGLSDGLTLSGPPPAGPILFQENGLTFESDPILGQKTGFFLDQRENRARVERLSMGQSVLNVFAYTGGFSVYAARGGARQVVSVDISAPAMQAAIRNMDHNRQISTVAATSHEILAEDAFEVLGRMASEKRRFDLVIIDPPMFAQNYSQTAAALLAYQRLTRLGLGVLRPGGVLVQASCSSRVTADAFFNAIHQAAGESNRRLTEIDRTGHALDHPIGFKEGAYLKCLFTRVV
ncbi:MAG: class I SAM-dependent rRNA methyltransferase [Chloroflexi bacterium HGW-Chloroflexi-6]|nr:MAG: class I SAM-dependent rRNA methyltransferase [Chloroflexi bacterium HGW-Chloroflexi-6]